MARRFRALWARVVIAVGLGLRAYWAPTPVSVVWLTPAEFARTTRPTTPTRVLRWLRQWLPGGNRGQLPQYDFRLQAFRPAAIGERITFSVAFIASVPVGEGTVR